MFRPAEPLRAVKQPNINNSDQALRSMVRQLQPATGAPLLLMSPSAEVLPGLPSYGSSVSRHPGTEKPWVVRTPPDYSAVLALAVRTTAAVVALACQSRAFLCRGRTCPSRIPRRVDEAPGWTTNLKPHPKPNPQGTMHVVVSTRRSNGCWGWRRDRA